MDDEGVEKLLDSSEPLVVVEAPAGSGKTYQGARYAERSSQALAFGKVLILAHTHAACGVFSDRTKSNRNRVEIKTIDSLVVQIASIYHTSILLPGDVSGWARSQENGFDELATKVAELLSKKVIISRALIKRYPVIICDEHQDASESQHQIVLSLYRAGAKMRVFGDPMQSIYVRTTNAIRRNEANWGDLIKMGAFAELEIPHRWEEGSLELGRWVMLARKSLMETGVIDLAGNLPKGLDVRVVNNVSSVPSLYQLDKIQRKPVDRIIDRSEQVLVLATSNETVHNLRSAFFRKLPIWEGHNRGPLSELVEKMSIQGIGVDEVASAAVEFVYEVSAGFSPSSHGDRFLKEVAEKCTSKATKKPLLLQNLARRLLDSPDHIGVSGLLGELKNLVVSGAPGFTDVKIDYWSALNDAIRLGGYLDGRDGLNQMQRKRSYLRPRPPERCLSTVHKAKGLECDNAVIMACDGKHFSATEYSKRRLYVALSRARCNLTIVLSKVTPTPLIKWEF